MYVSNLYIQNFKVLLDFHFSTSHSRIFITGLNGFGKTTLLEAIHTCLTSYSFSRQKDHDLLFYGKEDYTLLADITSYEDHHSLYLQYSSIHRKKRISLDGQSITRHRSLLEKFPVVAFTPLDIQNVIGEPAFRRLFFDRMLSYLNPDYYTALTSYKKILKERNQLLKLGEHSVLEMWNEKFLETATFLVNQRLISLESFNQLHQNLALEVPPFLKNIRWIYKGPTGKEALEKLLRKYHSQEIFKQITLFGPHRDDYLLCVGDKREVRYSFSLGQIKWVSFYMKLLEILLMNEKLNISPVFLIDDIFSELDTNNRQYVLSVLDSLPNQLFLTVTDLDWIPSYLKNNVDILSLEKPGKLSQKIS